MPLIEEIKKAKTIVIMPHRNMDGDALGSMLAMGHFCKNEFDKNPVLAFEGVIPDNMRFISNGWWMRKAEDIRDSVFDLAILVDTADIDSQLEIDGRALWANAKRRIKIDHHIDSPPIGDVNIIQMAAATSEIVANIAFENEWKITRDIARFLYVGIYMDTGGFVYDYTTPETMRTTARLMEFKLDHTEIARKVSEKTKGTFLNNLDTIARALFTDDDKIGYAAFSVKRTDGAERPHRETAWLHQQLLGVKDVEATAIFKEMDDGKIQVSVRSKTKPIHEFAAGFGGGGHLLASGFAVDGPLASAVVRVIPKLQAFINADD